MPLPSFAKVLEARVKFELNPVYPAEDCSDAMKLLWMQMTPKDRRKHFVLNEIQQSRTIPMVGGMCRRCCRLCYLCRCW